MKNESANGLGTNWKWYPLCQVIFTPAQLAKFIKLKAKARTVYIQLCESGLLNLNREGTRAHITLNVELTCLARDTKQANIKHTNTAARRLIFELTFANID